MEVFIIAKEYLMSINNFQEPKILEDTNTIATLLIRLILLEPGTIQSHPNMGIGLISRYRYCSSNDIENLKNDISKQISTYLPDFQYYNVDVTMVQRQLLLSINVDNVVYNLTPDFDNQTLSLSNLF